MQVDINSLKVGRYVIIDEKPCKVTSIIHSKPGKHGGAKARIEGIGIIDGKKRDMIRPSSATVEVPVVEKKKAQVLSLSPNSVQLMDLENYETFEMSIPDKLKGKLSEGETVIYWEVMGYKILKG